MSKGFHSEKWQGQIADWKLSPTFTKYDTGYPCKSGSVSFWHQICGFCAFILFFNLFLLKKKIISECIKRHSNYSILTCIGNSRVSPSVLGRITVRSLPRWWEPSRMDLAWSLAFFWEARVWILPLSHHCVTLSKFVHPFYLFSNICKGPLYNKNNVCQGLGPNSVRRSDH